MADSKSITQKYRFERTSNGFAFESRYYAQKFIDEILMKAPMNFGTGFEIVKIIDWYYIYEVRRVVIDDDFIDVV